MKVLIVGLIVLAFGVAGVSTYLIKNFSGKENLEELEKSARPKVFRVLVAAKDLPAGSALAADGMVWIDWPKANLHESYVVVEREDEQEKRLEPFLESLTRRPISAGEPIVPGKLFKRAANSSFLAGMLEKGMRALTFKIDGNKVSISSAVFPGDTVDVALTSKGPSAIADEQIKNNKKNQRKNTQNATDGDEAFAAGLESLVYKWSTETFMRNVKILAVNGRFDVPEGEPVETKTITLALTPKDFEIMRTAISIGGVTLILRSLEQDDKPAEAGTYTTDLEFLPLHSKLASGGRDLVDNKQQREFLKKIQQLNARNQTLQRQMGQNIEDLKRRNEAIKGQTDIKKPASKPKNLTPKKTQTIKIFRGGASDTQEINVK